MAEGERREPRSKSKDGLEDAEAPEMKLEISPTNQLHFRLEKKCLQSRNAPLHSLCSTIPRDHEMCVVLVHSAGNRQKGCELAVAPSSGLKKQT